MVLARIAETCSAIQWSVGGTLFALSILAIGFVEVVIVCPADAMSRQLKGILIYPSVEPVLQYGWV